MSGVLLRQRLPLVPYYDKGFAVPAQDSYALCANHRFTQAEAPTCAKALYLITPLIIRWLLLSQLSRHLVDHSAGALSPAKGFKLIGVLPKSRQPGFPYPLSLTASTVVTLGSLARG